MVFTLDFQERNLDWFPRLRAMSLAAEENDGEQNELRTLQSQLNCTNELVLLLSHQLTDLKEQMTEQRKQKQRKGFLHSATVPNIMPNMWSSVPSIKHLHKAALVNNSFIQWSKH